MEKPLVSEDLHQIRSEEIQEILSKPPTFLMRWGIPMLLLVFVGTLVLSHFIRYPDTVVANALLTSNPPPVRLMTKSAGYLRLLAREGEETQAGKPLAYLQNSANFEQILQLEKQLAQISLVQMLEIKALTQLGELQPHYDALLTAHGEWTIYQKYPTQQQAQNTLAQQIIQEKIKKENTLAQNALGKEAFEKTYLNYQIDSLLFYQKVKTPVEYNQAQNELLRQKQSVKSTEANIINQHSQIINMQEKLKEMRLQASEQEAKLLLSIETAFRNLNTQFALWKYRYLLVSPTAGKVHFLQYWADNQYVGVEQELISVISPTQNSLIQLRLSAQGAGKVQIGQTVWLELADFPAQEFGKLRGKVVRFAPMLQTNKQKENEGQYIAFAELASLKTDYGKTLPTKPEMQGQAHIATMDYSLLERLFQPLRKALGH